MADELDVAIVGGGPAGAATAIGLARRGYRVAVFERHATAGWRACGVFATPLTRKRLAALGMDASQVAALHRPISVMELGSASGAHCRLEYAGGPACGFDRVVLDVALLDLSVAVGADVMRGAVVRDVQLNRGSSTITYSDIASDPGPRRIKARVVVGADGGGSRVARAAGVLNERNWLGRSAITFHQHDPDAAPAGATMTARFVLGNGWYTGIAPVPNERVNIGIVVPTARLRAGVDQVIGEALGTIARPADSWISAPRTDEAQVRGRLEHHVTRAAGDGWLLVGDAIGFIDPLTGEGLYRALLSAELAERAIHQKLAGDHEALAVYDRRIRSRFRSKNVFSLVLQAFVANPLVLDYALRRLNSRKDLRDTLTGVLTDSTPASRVLDPRFMARLLAP